MITMRGLGRSGRWGNQVFQYMFLRTYANRYDLRYQCSPWVGQWLYGFDDPEITEDLPLYKERRDWSGGPERQDYGITYDPEGDEIRGHDFQGYAQFHTSYYRPEERTFAQQLFASPLPHADPANRMQPDGLARLTDPDTTLIGLHLRRGDTGRRIFYLTPNEWYLKWLEEHWSRFDNPVLFVATETQSDIADFADYSPITSAELFHLQAQPYRRYNYLRYDLDHPTPHSMDWWPDWWMLQQCNVLVFGNSTFSMTAALMNTSLQEAWRSRLSLRAFEKIEPWSEWSVTRELLRDHPGIPGTYYHSNPAWKGGEVSDRS